MESKLQVATSTSEVTYKKYLLAVLMSILAFNFVDRHVLGLTLQSIKVDLHLSDTQLGFMSGFAFAVFYAVMGIPIARWADRGNRVAIISLTVALWSVMVAMCGVAVNFAQLLLIRIGVGVGEAGCIPPAHSLIAEYFTRAERPRAVAIYLLGGPLSVIIGFFVAGWVNELYGWRMTFFALGTPGVLLAALAWTTLIEPRTGEQVRRLPLAEQLAPQPAQPSMREVCVTLWANATFRHLLYCFAVISFFGYGISQWLPTFFIRSYGMATGALGGWLALIYGGGGMAGAYCGGVLACRYAAGNERLQLRIMAALFAALSVTSACVYLSANKYVAFGLMLLCAAGGSATYGPTFATIQTLVPQRMRATSIAIVYLFANFIGMGLGPLSAGALSDWLRPWVGNESLRYALLILCAGYLWGAWHLLQGSRTVTLDVMAQVGARGDAQAHDPI